MPDAAAARLHAPDSADVALEAFVASVPGIRSAVLASVDGFVMAQAATAGNGHRLAAMTSSMLGLADAVARELALGALETLMLEAGDGKVLMLAVPTATRPLLLMAACSQRSTAGHVLWAARECARRIRAGGIAG